MSSNPKSAGGRAATDSATQTGVPASQAPLGGAQVPAGILLDLDALAQQCCGEVSTLADVAISSLALEPAALIRVRQLLLLIKDRALELKDCINGEAERQGCNYVDDAGRAFAMQLQRAQRGAA